MKETRIAAKAAAQPAQNLRTPEIIAAEINYITQYTRETVLSSAIEIGRRLIEAKELVPHGQWETWLKENVSYSQSTANNLMAVYREYGSDQQSLFKGANSQALEDLSYSKAVALLVLPKEQREEFISQNPVEEMSTRQLQTAIKQAQEAQKQMDIAIVERQRYQKQAGEEMARANKLTTDNKYLETKVRNLQKQVEEAQKAAEELESIREKQRKAQEREKKLKEKIQQLQQEQGQPDQQTIDQITAQAQQQAQQAARQEMEQLQQQLAATREEKEQISKRLAITGSEEMIQAKVLLSQLQGDFNRMLDLAVSLENKGDRENAHKLRGAISSLCSKMKERIEK